MYKCPICNNSTKLFFSHKIQKSFYREFYLCENCIFIFVPNEFHITKELELDRYNLHNWGSTNLDEIEDNISKLTINESENNRVNFFDEISKIIVDLLFLKVSIIDFEIKKTLDFGCGKFTSFSKILEINFNKSKLNHKIVDTNNYDFYYHKNETLLSNTNYNLITSFEVFEHLRNPINELNKIVAILEYDGFLVIETQLLDNISEYKFNNSIELIDVEKLKNSFGNWWYKNDITHINFYSNRTFEVLANKLNLKIIPIKEIKDVNKLIDKNKINNILFFEK